MVDCLAAVALFGAGLYLSALFSGSETGFYRVSRIKVQLESRVGDRFAGWLLWFLRRPTHFVATTLVGNNVANYITTVSVGLFTARVIGTVSTWAEIVGTLVVSPVVFVFGELVPKSLFLQAPYALLRKSAKIFRVCYWLFWPLTMPLVGLIRLVNRGGDGFAAESTFRRQRLMQIIQRGSRVGTVDPIQRDLVLSIFELGSTRVRDRVEPVHRFVVADEWDREELLRRAGRRTTPIVLLTSEGGERPTHYVHVADLLFSRRSVGRLVHPLPVLDGELEQLEAVAWMRRQDADWALVELRGRWVGVFSLPTLPVGHVRDSDAVVMPEVTGPRSGED
ncbi:MAG: DUF21 domain-containing protein [Planctomycetota bacterium]|nr:MAG: DUF21 domain-containing protein [Planctomycetota bacterium]